MHAEDLARLRRILAVRLDNIGDIVLLTPALRALREAAPQASITLLASPAGAQVAPLVPWLDDVIVHQAVWQEVAPWRAQPPEVEAAFVERLAAGRFDVAFIFTSFRQSPYPPAFACYEAGIPRRIGQSKEFGGQVLTDWIEPPPDDVYQADRNLYLLEHAGVEVRQRSPQLHLPASTLESAAGLLREVGLDNEPFIALAPGASCQARSYHPDRFLEATKRLCEQTGLPALVLGTAREAAELDPQPPLRSLVGRTSVPEFAAILARSSLVLCNNSSATHFAEAFQRPVVVLYSGTDLESQWRPRQTRSVLLRHETDCTPCYGLTCPFNLECLDFPPEAVVDAALELIESPERQAV